MKVEWSVTYVFSNVQVHSAHRETVIVWIAVNKIKVTCYICY
jgi:hypothetical protein